MEKVLKSSARVPDNLYVKRGADSQIKKVIKEMLRPGYISVARQMGKTNLLQNAKREIESPYDIVIYIDLSAAKYDTSRQYFRSVIDTILEVHEDLLCDAKNSITERRKDLSISASGEHDRELRAILKFIPQRLVLILDEVDTLAKSEFSDEIFAQIRSIYFMRSTYSILDKLTYILSGVIEPTKLIKNKDNSPFNIAEQIYLDDFSYDEMQDFVNKSELPVSEEIRSELYNWTNGNPRMTYEICSALEDLSINGNIITVNDVQNVIYKIYLTDFNAAPIDHIRDIVANNSLIRDAIKNIKLGINIADELKDQLYLYGIVESKFKSKSPKIKNKIIDLALSIDWLENVDSQTKGFYEFGLEKISQGNYKDGIAYILRYAESPNTSDYQRATAYISIANAYEIQQEYSASNEYYEKVTFDKRKYPYDYYFKLLKTGLNLISMNKIDDGCLCYDEIISDSSRDANYYSASLNKAIAKLNANFNENRQYSLGIFEALKNDSELLKMPEEFANGIVSVCNVKAADIKLSLELHDEARSYLSMALEQAPLELLPSVLTSLIHISIQPDSYLFVSRLVEILLNDNLRLQSKGLLTIEFTDKALWQSLATVYEFQRESFDAVVSHAITNLYNNSMEYHTLMHGVGHQLVIKPRMNKLNARKLAREIFHLGLDSPNINDLYKAKLYQSVAIALDESQSSPKFLSYVHKAFEAMNKVQDNRDITYYDIITFSVAAATYRERGEYAKALAYINYVIDRLDAPDEETLTGDAIIIYYLKANILASLDVIEESKKCFLKAKSLISKWDKSKFLILSNNEHLEQMIVDIENSVSTFANLSDISAQQVKQPKQIAVRNKIPRNTIVVVRYEDGKVLRGKYKKFEQDVINIKCVIINN